ncbi:alpha-2Db adrenergic receptor-like [Saccostrea cucullata]|uniref:alpha-2Db adrenergic receptor-like n=1 Tax=Saccostrea cuccullata TaxID=36930 RepID=UPI002ED6AB79
MVTNDVICHGMEVVRHSSVAFSNLILILIAGERLLLVWKPMKKYVTAKMKTIFILVLLLISVICSIPAALIIEVAPHSNDASKNETNQPKVFNHGTETSETFCWYTTTTLGDNGSKIYRDFLSTMISAELLLLIIIYVIVYVILYTHKKRIRHSVSHSTGQPSENPQKLEERRERGILNKSTNGDSIETYSPRPGTCPEPNTEEGSAAHSRTESPVEGVTSSQEDGLQISQTRKNKVQKRKKILRFSKSTSYVRTKTWTMMFVCTFIYLICWIPFFFAIFNIYDSLVFRYFFFLGHATNPIVYSVVNKKIRQGIADILKKFNICL